MEIALITHGIGGWVFPRACLDVLEEREKSLDPAGNGTKLIDATAYKQTPTNFQNEIFQVS
jgi:hypothetical protein